MLKRGTLLLLWGLTLLWSFHSGRLDLLLRGVFHGLVGVTGLVLLMLGVALLLKREQQEGKADGRAGGRNGRKESKAGRPRKHSAEFPRDFGQATHVIRNLRTQLHEGRRCQKC